MTKTDEIIAKFIDKARKSCHDNASCTGCKYLDPKYEVCEYKQIFSGPPCTWYKKDILKRIEVVEPNLFEKNKKQKKRRN